MLYCLLLTIVITVFGKSGSLGPLSEDRWYFLTVGRLVKNYLLACDFFSGVDVFTA